MLSEGNLPYLTLNVPIVVNVYTIKTVKMTRAVVKLTKIIYNIIARGNLEEVIMLPYNIKRNLKKMAKQSIQPVKITGW